MPTINRKHNSIKSVKWTSNQSAKYYNSRGWRSLRNSYINTHPLCERCLLNGRSVPATDAHHIVPFLRGKTDEERWSLLLSYGNLMALCEECHHEVHKHN